MVILCDDRMKREIKLFLIDVISRILFTTSRLNVPTYFPTTCTRDDPYVPLHTQNKPRRTSHSPVQPSALFLGTEHCRLAHQLSCERFVSLKLGNCI